MNDKSIRDFDKFDNFIKNWVYYLNNIQGYSKNTYTSYERDILDFYQFCNKQKTLIFKTDKYLLRNYKTKGKKLNIAILGSTNGTSTSLLLDKITELNAEIKVVISNRKNAYILDKFRSKGISCVYLRSKKNISKEE